MIRHVLSVALAVGVVVGPAGAQEVPLDRLNLPDGFRIEVFASGVENARQMALSPDGTLFVGTRQAGNVYAVLDENKDRVADKVVTVASGLNMPNGVAFRDGALYVAEVNRVLRYDGIESRLDSPPEPVVLNDQLPRSASTVGNTSGSGPTGSCMSRSVRRATSATGQVKIRALERSSGWTPMARVRRSSREESEIPWASTGSLAPASCGSPTTNEIVSATRVPRIRCTMRPRLASTLDIPSVMAATCRILSSPTVRASSSARPRRSSDRTSLQSG